MEEVQENNIAGFWKRLFALFIDLLLLGGVGFVLGLFFESTFVEIGDWGKLIGFAIALSYFGVMNSQVGSGQTLGKRIVKIKVVNAEGSYINIPKSLLRYSILSIPFFLNGTHFSSGEETLWLAYILVPIVFGGVLSIAYLYIFNRRTRQSLHDIAVKTYVVKDESVNTVPAKVWKFHIILVGVFFLFMVIAPLFLEEVFTKFTNSLPMKELAVTRSTLESEPLVKSAAVTVGTSTITSSEHGKATSTHANIHITLMNKDVSNAVLAGRYAQIVMDYFPDVKNKDAINITLSYGYDIGIWSQWYNHTHVFNPAELQVVKAGSI